MTQHPSAEMPQAQAAAEGPRLGLPALTALVVGSMIGGGIFALPTNVAVSAAPGPMLIGWAITAVGMLALALVFQMLANRRPDLNTGIYAYAKAGFGNFMGFSSAWGYWISAFIGTVSYFVLMGSTIGQFIPAFGEGNTAAAIGFASALLWTIHALVLRGIRTAATLNMLTTIAKVVPLILFLILSVLAFRFGVFTADFWGQASPNLGSTLDQVKAMMMVTVWVFIGIEGASTYSSRAARRSDIGRGTVLGFLLTLFLLVGVNVLSMGIMSQQELAGLQDPSVAYVLEAVVGPWGAWLIRAGLLVSLLGAMLAWTLLCTEILYAAAKDKEMPRFLARENAYGVPSGALLATNLMVQLFLLLTYFNDSTYLTLLYLASATILLPYLFSAAYGLMVASRDHYASARERTRDQWTAGLAVLYALWLLYAAGPQYLLLSSLLYAPGALLFVKARREQGLPVFRPWELGLLSLLVLAALYAAYGLKQGFLTL
ncbi:arginine-ornithine antiporter [Deinococcus piscis]|uniref:Arginine-ornithine antiporter n=1 Tax=Deinococcus piscis TaxID=394230 RepID=A0ABQ3K0W6_9DEIO|nr:arginine-ornithine antiporter [Deinococcus piscis]GHF94005.1 arginine-ornithine antiporter [Deinococcus piscis]